MESPGRTGIYRSSDSKVHGAIMGPIGGRQDPGGSRVGSMNFAIWVLAGSIPWTDKTHWGRVTLICVHKLTIILSDNGLSPSWCQAAIWNIAGILLIGPLGTNFSEISLEIHTFSLKKIYMKMPSGNCGYFCLGLNVLNRFV